MDRKTVIGVCLMALVSLHTIQQVSASKLLRLILSQLRPSECDSLISPENIDALPPQLQSLLPPQLQPALPPVLPPVLPPLLPPLQPNEGLNLIEELLRIRRLLEQGCRPLNLSPLGTEVNYPPSISQAEYAGLLNN
ncbi:uncharacterized protein LOC117226168 [Megalopta genalis]|uniref:uncharacterized protein LOC117226168 n=1 Tax=Megalopta genalis TaxID=115081 RepID=UPI003FD694F4